MDGVFLTGWARKASEGLVGIAKRDGEWCTEVLMRYLDGKGPLDRDARERVVRTLAQTLAMRNVRAVDIQSLRLLGAAEQEHGASAESIGEFKFPTNQEMLALIEKRREAMSTPVRR
jgi:ferredoxin--NADP+ reductase